MSASEAPRTGVDYLPVDTGDPGLNREVNTEIAHRHADAFTMPLPWWWLSFVDPELPEGDRFLGVCVVQGANVVDAVERAWALGCNPGGAVAGWVLPPLEEPDPEWRERLLTRAEAEAL